MERNIKNEIALKQYSKLFHAAWEDKGFLSAQLVKTLEERNALEKELEALKEKYKELEELYHDYDSYGE